MEEKKNRNEGRKTEIKESVKRKAEKDDMNMNKRPSWKKTICYFEKKGTNNLETIASNRALLAMVDP
jgi:hypothetical protein